jgi:TPR repeat protein
MKNLILALVLIWAMPALAEADYQEATDAFDKGDSLTALKEFQSLADDNDASGQYGLGIMYDLGEEVSQSAEQAAKWYKLSAEQGHADAQNNLGVMYEEGEGVPRNYDEAMRWYRRAAESGNKDAPNNIGVLYMSGVGAIKDSVKAYMWFSVAGKGDPAAISNKKFLLKRLTPDELKRAKNMAQEWLKIREQKNKN